MYYEEKLIKGVLMCRYKPDGKWEQCSITKMSSWIVEQKERIIELEAALEKEHREQWSHLINYEPHPLLTKETT